MPIKRFRKTAHKLTTKDLFKFKLPTSVAISPDEARVIYTVERIDPKANKYFSNIFLHDLENDKTIQFTHGDHNDRQPVFSPDGSEIAFVSTRNKKTGIYLISSSGGAERQLIELDAAISSLQWLPDGNSLLFALRYNDSHYTEDEKKKKEQPVYRHITRLFNRLDGAGFLPKDRFQIYSLQIDPVRLSKITSGKRDNNSPTVSPDGKYVAYISNRSRDEDIDYNCHDILMMPLKGKKEKKIATPSGPVATLAFSPDSKTIGYIGHDNPDDGWGKTNMHVWKVGISGNPKAKDLMPKFDRNAYDDSISDLSDVGESASLSWSGDGKRLFFLSSDTGTTSLYSLPHTGGKPTRLFKGKVHLKGFSVNGRTRTAALIYADIKTPGDVVTIPTKYGGETKVTRLSNLNSFLKNEVTLARTKDLMFRSFDGTKVQGWLVLPPGFSARRKYPAILNIHGGPSAQYAHTFFHEMQFLAASGYVVLYTNPRGGTGRGELWSNAISGGWGDLDYKDCMAAADYLESLPYVKSNRIGVTGGSYGGFMTNWMIGHTNRFAAAITQRSVVDLRSFYGSSDIGYALEREYGNQQPWTDPELYEKGSPITYFRKVKTPVLIIHSEQDLRCHIEQADQMFVMLKRLGKKVEMVRFPEEPHGLSRHGRPDRRIARLEWIKKWFDRYLKK